MWLFVACLLGWAVGWAMALYFYDQKHAANQELWAAELVRAKSAVYREVMKIEAKHWRECARCENAASALYAEGIQHLEARRFTAEETAATNKLPPQRQTTTDDPISGGND